MVNIKAVKTGKDLNEFIDFPYKLYAGEKNYVPELRIVQKETLNKKKNPFFQHADAAYFTAKNDNGEVVGRIAAITNENYVKHWNENYGFFGFSCFPQCNTLKIIKDNIVKFPLLFIHTQ